MTATPNDFYPRYIKVLKKFYEIASDESRLPEDMDFILEKFETICLDVIQAEDEGVKVNEVGLSEMVMASINSYIDYHVNDDGANSFKGEQCPKYYHKYYETDKVEERLIQQYQDSEKYRNGVFNRKPLIKQIEKVIDVVSSQIQ